MSSSKTTYIINKINEARTNNQLNRYVENRKLRTAITEGHNQNLFSIAKIKKKGAIQSKLLANDLDHIIKGKENAVDELLWRHDVLKDGKEFERFYEIKPSNDEKKDGDVRADVELITMKETIKGNHNENGKKETEETNVKMKVKETEETIAKMKMNVNVTEKSVPKPSTDNNFQFIVHRAFMDNCSETYASKTKKITSLGKIEFNVRKSMIEFWKKDDIAKFGDDGNVVVDKEKMMAWINESFSVKLPDDCYISTKAQRISEGVFVLTIMTKRHDIAMKMINQRNRVMNKRGGINFVFPARNEYRVKLNGLKKKKVIKSWYINKRSAKITIVYMVENVETFYMLKNEIEIDYIVINHHKINDIVARIASNQKFDVDINGVIKIE